jgi:hypothetical protein
VKKETKEKKKRAPSAYNLFVKTHYQSVKDLPSNQRFKALAKQWAEHKAANATEKKE